MTFEEAKQCIIDLHLLEFSEHCNMSEEEFTAEYEKLKKAISSEDTEAIQIENGNLVRAVLMVDEALDTLKNLWQPSKAVMIG